MSPLQQQQFKNIDLFLINNYHAISVHLLIQFHYLREIGIAKRNEFSTTSDTFPHINHKRRFKKICLNRNHFHDNRQNSHYFYIHAKSFH